MDAQRKDGEVVFVSYSREDAEWRRRIVGMLAPVVRDRRLDVWSDDLMLVGQGWRPQIEDAIDRAGAALLLVSRPFLESDFIMDDELPALVARGIPLVCVLVRQCLWDEVAALADVQWAHDPGRDGSLATSADPDRQIVRICKRLLEVVPPRAATAPASGAPQRPAGARASEAIAPHGEPGALHDVPPLPAGFVARDELDELRAAVLRGSDVGITGKALGLHGQGGIGKTVLAAALARDADVRGHFPAGVHWVSVGERPDLVASQIALLARLGAPHEELRSAAKGVVLLREALADRQCLLVVDDVWSVAAAQAFAAAGPRGRVVYTTRDASVLRAVGAEVRRVDVLPDAAARELLARLTGAGVDELPDEASFVLAATGRVALGLALVGAAIGRGGRGWREVADELERGGETFLDHPYANIFKTMQVAVGALDGELAEAYETLAVYPEDTYVPVAAVARHWSLARDATPERTRADLEDLAARELLSLDGDAIAFHDLQRDFLLLHTHDLALLHADLLAAYRALLPSADSAWRELAPGEPYISEHLIYHLRGAGDGSAILATTSDLRYLALRAFRGGPHAAESDLRMAADALGDEPLVGWLLRLLAQSGHLLGGHRTVGDLAATLATRIRDAPATLDAGVLANLVGDCCLVERWGLPGPVYTRVLEGHAGWVGAVAFSPDGRLLASAGHDGEVRLWDPATGTRVRALEGQTDALSSVAFSPDGRLLASAGADPGVRLWNVETGTQIRVLKGHADEVNFVAFSPDGRLLASAGDDATIRLWETDTGVQVHTLEGHSSRVNAVAFSPDGLRLASAGGDPDVRLWETATGMPTATLHGHAQWVNTVAFSPDGRLLASAGKDRKVRLWDAETGTPARTLPGHVNTVNAVAFSPDGRLLASAAGDQTIRLWDAAVGTPRRILDGHGGGANAVAFSPDGRLLASAAGDRTVRLWDTTPGTLAHPSEGHTNRVNAVALSPDGRLLASAGYDRTVRLWDTASGTPTQILEGHKSSVNAIAFSPDGERLASAGKDRWVRIWDPSSGTQVQTLDVHTAEAIPIGGMEGVAFSPDGRLLAGAGVDDAVRLWDIATGTSPQTLEAHSRGVKAVAFSPDGRLLASAGNDATVRLWDVATGTLARTLEGHVDPVYAVAFSPDSRRLASAGHDPAIQLWDMATGTSVPLLVGDPHGAWAIAFSPDGRLLAGSGHDRVVRLWDARTGMEVSALRLEAAVAALAWGSCGVAVASNTNVILLDVRSRTGADPAVPDSPRIA